MPNYEGYATDMSFNPHFNARLNAFTAYGRGAFATALGLYLVELETRIEDFVRLWNISLPLDPLPEGDPSPGVMQSLADSYDIPLSFSADGTLSIVV